MMDFIAIAYLIVGFLYGVSIAKGWVDEAHECNEEIDNAHHFVMALALIFFTVVGGMMIFSKALVKLIEVTRK